MASWGERAYGFVGGKLGGMFSGIAGADFSPKGGGGLVGKLGGLGGMFSGMGGGGLAGVAGKLGMATNPLGWAQMGIGAVTDIMGTSAERKAGKQKVKMIGGQLQQVEDAGEQLTEAVGMKTELAGDVYDTGEAQLMSRTGESLYGLTRQGQTLSAKVGFAGSGQVDKQMARGTEQMVDQFGFQQQGLQDVLGQKMMDIGEWEGAQRGQLESQKTALEYEMKQAQAQANKKYLGVFG